VSALEAAPGSWSGLDWDARSVAEWVGRHLLGVQIDKGRIRFGGLTPTERRLTVAALVTVGAVILLILFPSVVPSGNTIQLYSGYGAETIDTSASALLLLALGFFVGLVAYAAFDCPPFLRVLAAVGFLLTAAQIANSIGNYWGGFLPAFILASYVIVPLGLVVSASEHTKLYKRLGHGGAWVAGKARWIALGGVAVFFLSSTLLYGIGLHNAGFQASSGSALVNDIAIPVQETLYDFYGGMVVLFIVASLAVVRFSYGIGQIVCGVVRRAPARWTRWALVGLMVAEVFFLLRRYPGYGWADLKQYPQIAILSALSLVAFVWMTLGARGLFGTPRREVETERVIFRGAGAYSFGLVLVGVLTSASWILATFFPKGGVSAIPDPFGWLSNHAQDLGFQVGSTAALFALLVVIGMRRANAGASLETRQAGFGLVLVSGWALWTYIVSYIAPLPMYAVLLTNLTLIVTAAVAVDMVRHWNALSAQRLGVLTGIVALSWLISTDGGFLSIIGGWVGLKRNVPLAFGALLTLIGASEFAGGNSRVFPRRARPLVWLSYVGISLLFRLSFQFTHGLNVIEQEYGLDTTAGYLLMAPPFAAWLVLTGWFEEHMSPKEAGAAGAIAEPALRPTVTETS
jgi:hypothetical protein